MASTGILRLPNELLVHIFEFVDLPNIGNEHRDIFNVRLTCRFFNVLSSPLLLPLLGIDISRPETVSRLQEIVANPYIAKGVKLLDIRVHFYHPWVAATYENFVKSLKAEWGGGGDITDWRSFTRPNVYIETIVGLFFAKLASEELGHGELEYDTNAVTTTPDTLRVCTSEVLSKAYDAYKSAFQAQERILSNGDFLSALSHFLSKFTNLTHINIYDRTFYTYYTVQELDDDIVVNSDDDAGQVKALVGALARPMVWQMTREIMQLIDAAEELKKGVPVELLIDIPVAIAKAKPSSINYLSIEVSPPPDYTLLPTDPDRLALLSTALKSMPLSLLWFAPCRLNAPEMEPWGNYPPVTPQSISSAEIQALNQYLGALLDGHSRCNVYLDLKELWDNALVTFEDVTASLGDNWRLRPGTGPGPSRILLSTMNIKFDDIKRFATALAVGTELYLRQINLLEGNWENMLATLRRMRRRPSISIEQPFGGGLDGLDQETYDQIFGEQFRSENGICRIIGRG